MNSFKERCSATMKYQPCRDEEWRVVESDTDYVQRMQQTVLPQWPAEVLAEWLFRQADFMDDYVFLDFQNMRFEKVLWRTESLPGREAFRDPSFCDSFENVEERASQNKHDWLAHHMLEKGTWNTPIVLLKNHDSPPKWEESGIKIPYHLLEGHRRLSFLQGLIRLNKALPAHTLWVVRAPNPLLQKSLH